MGTGKDADEPLLPTFVAGAPRGGGGGGGGVGGSAVGGGGGGGGAGAGGVVMSAGPLSAADEYYAKHGIPMQGEEGPASWDDFTNEAKVSPPTHLLPPHRPSPLLCLSLPTGIKCPSTKDVC